MQADPSKKPGFTCAPDGSNDVYNMLGTVLVTYYGFYDTAEVFTFCEPGVQAASTAPQRDLQPYRPGTQLGRAGILAGLGVHCVTITLLDFFDFVGVVDLLHNVIERDGIGRGVIDNWHPYRGRERSQHVFLVERIGRIRRIGRAQRRGISRDRHRAGDGSARARGRRILASEMAATSSSDGDGRDEDGKI
ncbi:44c00af2-04db-44d6-a6b4-58aa4e5c0870 [Thermothielavioides terrestris]|uniref:44c00af2-04db-44d6-a6b4-58aa4e5c0870 n=1 Tax=Thermothielavioides terrestris TaxID=2587410 RepID=A0A3S4F4I8_9PEZI|nr:44c00af2-04db-44d6-a6b4-58aa4e5c0870 [Thermothielavioides terrestris]